MGTSRRLDGNKQDAFGRALAAVQSVDSSIVQEEYNTTAVVTVGDAELLTPTAAPTEDDSTVANAEDDGSSDLNGIIFPAAIGVGAVALVCFVYCCFCKKKEPPASDNFDNPFADIEVVKATGVERALAHHQRPDSNV